MADRERAAVEWVLGNLLRGGVALAAGVILLGTVLFLADHGWERPDYRMFRGEPPELRSIPDLLAQAARGSGRGIIQLGVLLLIATPIARVASSVWAFAREGDKRYVAIALMVLGVLAYSLLGVR